LRRGAALDEKGVCVTDYGRLSKLRRELSGLVKKGGRDFTGLSQEELDRVEELSDAIDDIYDAKGFHKPDKHPGFPTSGRGSGGSGRGKVQAPTPGWKAGHWATPVERYMNGPDGVKALTSGSVVVPALTGGIVGIPDRPAVVTDVVPTDDLDNTNTAAFMQETVRNLNATEVAEGALKPTSVLTVQKVEEPARTIATLSEPVNRHDLEDANLLSAYIDNSLSQAVRLRLDLQIVAGNGTAPNLRGMLNVSGVRTQAFSNSVLETARKALTKLYDVNIDGGVYVVPTSIWEQLELTVLGTGSGPTPCRPRARSSRSIWPPAACGARGSSSRA
jgi:Phage capsid family